MSKNITNQVSQVLSTVMSNGWAFSIHDITTVLRDLSMQVKHDDVKAVVTQLLSQTALDNFGYVVGSYGLGYRVYTRNQSDSYDPNFFKNKTYQNVKVKPAALTTAKPVTKAVAKPVSTAKASVSKTPTKTTGKVATKPVVKDAVIATVVKYINADNRIKVPANMLDKNETYYIYFTSVQNAVVLSTEKWKGHTLLGEVEVNSDNNIAINSSVLNLLPNQSKFKIEQKANYIKITSI